MRSHPHSFIHPFIHSFIHSFIECMYKKSKHARLNSSLKCPVMHVHFEGKELVRERQQKGNFKCRAWPDAQKELAGRKSAETKQNKTERKYPSIKHDGPASSFRNFKRTARAMFSRGACPLHGASYRKKVLSGEPT
mmetsp:Transcript_15717/g.31866  ORF Transcript_15717/g.31866 Transcript_15717/m.31866 type:complete len:136 (+) Transcript_15717:251-658(+)